MYEKLLEQIQSHGMELVTMGGKVSPYVGAGIAVLLTVVLIFLGFKVKKRKWEDAKKKAGETIGDQTADDQQTTDSVHSDVDDFFNTNRE